MQRTIGIDTTEKLIDLGPFSVKLLSVQVLNTNQTSRHFTAVVLYQDKALPAFHHGRKKFCAGRH